jgi:hypothetical protein
MGKPGFPYLGAYKIPNYFLGVFRSYLRHNFRGEL